ncbi:DUF411 domain-containing protein [Sulfitobacter sp. S0837]|uniref:DUF411 domain-containing protein n=1 Tax=Sulfitobacter maritimus TaxID=2741719 RepID=UPI001582BFF9|nr:DUF411 domain-containing protein [Sulfitobacter maritimus]NUH64194.1 DUF411 domain-containing protein [Sulfitobacter maritimus]
MTLTRRSLLTSFAGLAATAPFASWAGEKPVIHVMKDPNCGCCSAWIEILEQEGFAVTTENSLGTLLIKYKQDSGIPQNMASCHTAKIDGYMIEGHVPPADIHKLLAMRPDAIGLAVPGMPYGSPGMGPEAERDAYDVYLIARDGSTEVFTSYKAA